MSVAIAPSSLFKWYDATFSLTSEASEFKVLCDEVHAFTDRVITERRELVVRAANVALYVCKSHIRITSYCLKVLFYSFRLLFSSATTAAAAAAAAASTITY